MKISVKAWVLSVVCIITLTLLSSVAFAQNVTIINSLFQGPSLSDAFVQGTDRKLYAVAPFRGTHHGAGSVFKVAPLTGKIKAIYNFCPGGIPCVDGEYPMGQLLPMPDGSFYGTTFLGGAYPQGSNAHEGSVFHLTAQGVLTTIYSFCALAGCADGQRPMAGLTLGNDGNFYGTTYQGGNSTNGGTIFQLTPAGQLTTLYDFCAQDSPNNCPDGAQPVANMLRASDGNLYGSTLYGGDYHWSSFGEGTIFRIAPDGTFTQFYMFCVQNSCPDGEFPNSALIQGTDGNFYGTTTGGGAGNHGSVFQMTPNGVLNTLYSFCDLPSGFCTDGSEPNGLMQASDGNFYGTTGGGGLYNAGTIFELTPTGQFTSLYSFCSTTGCPDGNDPLAGLFQASNGMLYGTTTKGGKSNYGTTFKVSIN